MLIYSRTQKRTIQHALSNCLNNISNNSEIRIMKKSKTYQKYFWHQIEEKLISVWIFIFFVFVFGKQGPSKRLITSELKSIYPIVTHIQRIAYALKSKVWKEIKHMVDFKIIQLVNEPTDWVNEPVIVEIRVFPDPQPINQTITH